MATMTFERRRTIRTPPVGGVAVVVAQRIPQTSASLVPPFSTARSIAGVGEQRRRENIRGVSSGGCRWSIPATHYSRELTR